MRRLIVSVFLLILPLMSIAGTLVIRPGDRIQITMPGEPEYDKPFTVDHNGNILLPEMGEVKISGKTLKQADKELKFVLGDIYRDLSHMKLRVLKERELLVTVLGAVKGPGKQVLPSNANVQMALASAGGLTENANLEDLQIKRSSGVITFNYKKYLNTGNQQILPSLNSSDVIFVPNEHMIKIIGAVSKPGTYAWSKDKSFLDYIILAGGTTKVADISAIKVLGIDRNGKKTKTKKFNMEKYIDAGGNVNSLPKIQPGDVIRVPDLYVEATDSKSAWLKQKSSESIYLFGQVSRPGRYQFNRSMNFLDILSAANGPTGTADLRNIRVIHRDKNKPRITYVNLSEYFETGDPSLLPKIVPGDAIYLPSLTRDWLDKSKESTVRVLGSVGRPGRYQYNDTMTILDILAEAGGPQDDAYISKIVVVNMSSTSHKASTFDLVKFAKTGNPQLLPVIRAGDTIYVPSDNQRHWVKFFKALGDITSIIVILSVVNII